MRKLKADLHSANFSRVNYLLFNQSISIWREWNLDYLLRHMFCSLKIINLLLILKSAKNFFFIWNMAYEFSMILFFSSTSLNSSANSKVSFYVSFREINCIKIQTMRLVLTSSFASDWKKWQGIVELYISWPSNKKYFMAPTINFSLAFKPWLSQYFKVSSIQRNIQSTKKR